jgi:hypothetical protein
MKSAAERANKVCKELDALPAGFARTVVACYVYQMTRKERKKLFGLVHAMDEAESLKGKIVKFEG